MKKSENKFIKQFFSETGLSKVDIDMDIRTEKTNACFFNALCLDNN